MENKKAREKAVVICSGGLDSTVLVYDAVKSGYDVKVITFDYNQKHRKEIKFAKKTSGKLGLEHVVLDLNILKQIAPSALTRENWQVPKGHYEDDNMKQTVVPNRNMVMLSLASAYAISQKASKLFYGAHAGDHAIYPDCRAEFVDAMKKAISLADWHNVELDAPYANITKADVLKKGIELKVPFEDTWSCYEGQEFACGTCGTCVERLEAFEIAQVKDPLKYK